MINYKQGPKHPSFYPYFIKFINDWAPLAAFLFLKCIKLEERTAEITFRGLI